MKNKQRIILFSTTLLLISTLNIIKKETIYSPKENRYLQTFPEFTWDKFIQGSFNQEIEKYTSDQFLYRDKWVSTNTNIERLLGKKDNGRVYFGTNQWLYSTKETLDQKQVDKNLLILKEFAEKHQQDIKINYLLIPSKATIMSQNLPKNAPTHNEEKLLKHIEDTLGKYGEIPDTISTLNQYNHFPLYYRTDHHWTSLGAYYAYQTLFNEHSFTINNYTPEVISNAFYGSDYRKANLDTIHADTIEVLMRESIRNQTFLSDDKTLPLFNTEEKNTYSYYQGGDHAIAQIKGHTQNKKHLLLIKDSFANTLLPYLLPHYETITFIDLRYYNAKVSDLIETNTFDEILFTYGIQNFIQDKTISKLKY